jgi:hypothetical protein
MRRHRTAGATGQHQGPCAAWLHVACFHVCLEPPALVVGCRRGAPCRWCSEAGAHLSQLSAMSPSHRSETTAWASGTCTQWRGVRCKVVIHTVMT